MSVAHSSFAKSDMHLAPAQLAKATLRRLSLEHLEPTPDNYSRIYYSEAGVKNLPPHTLPTREAHEVTIPDSTPWADLITRIVKGLERSHRDWTPGRKKESLQRLLDANKNNLPRLAHLLKQLLTSWENNKSSPAGDLDLSLSEAQPDNKSAAQRTANTTATIELAASSRPTAAVEQPETESGQLQLWGEAVQELQVTIVEGLPDPDERIQAANRALTQATVGLLQHANQTPLTSAHLEPMRAACQQTRRILQQRSHLIEQLSQLCFELTESLTELSEDDSWVRGQCLTMRYQLEDGLNVRGVKRVSQLLHNTRQRQQELNQQRQLARAALKQLIQQMLQEIADLSHHTDRFQNNLGRYAETVDQAANLESLAGIVHDMVQDTLTVQSLVTQTHQKLQSEHARSNELLDRVKELESEIRRLSDEVSTDPLTQISNRRGLLKAFEIEQSRVGRTGSQLSLALLDVDNFKRLNDELGHQAGDNALCFLADTIKSMLRPSDVLARYGGEEFVMLLPETPLDEAQAVIGRLQRQLSAQVFLHSNQQMFITFSAGVTMYKVGETIDILLERADEALYEAKRTGKNRTCLA